MATRKFSELLTAMPASRRRKIEQRVERTLAELPLDELRRAREMTQQRLASILGINQSEVSKIEHRADMYVSTLAEYVQALGGRLEIRAVFKDQEVRITHFEELAK